MKQDVGLGTEEIPIGRTPAELPPRVTDFEELDKKAIDVLLDSLKYVATTSGIVIAMYSPAARENVASPRFALTPAQRPSYSLHLFCGSWRLSERS